MIFWIFHVHTETYQVSSEPSFSVHDIETYQLSSDPSFSVHDIETYQLSSDPSLLLCAWYWNRSEVVLIGKMSMTSSVHSLALRQNDIVHMRLSASLVISYFSNFHHCSHETQSTSWVHPVTKVAPGTTSRSSTPASRSRASSHSSLAAAHGVVPKPVRAM